MTLIADIMLLLGAIGIAIYCFVLSRRLKRFNDLETGVGGAIAVLSAQVDDMIKALEGAQTIAASSAMSLDGLTERAESASRRLELLVAALHDLPDPKAADLARQAAERPAPDPAPKPAETVFLSQRARVNGAGA